MHPYLTPRSILYGVCRVAKQMMSLNFSIALFYIFFLISGFTRQKLPSVCSSCKAKASFTGTWTLPRAHLGSSASLPCLFLSLLWKPDATVGAESPLLTWACVLPGSVAHCPGRVWAALWGASRAPQTLPPVPARNAGVRPSVLRGGGSPTGHSTSVSCTEAPHLGLGSEQSVSAGGM